MFQRILIANRGEIALRIIRACKELGVESVAVYSLADKDAPYLELADRAICIGPSHEAIRKMGLKTEAKVVAAAARVPCVPGSEGPITSDAEAARIAREIG